MGVPKQVRGLKGACFRWDTGGTKTLEGYARVRRAMLVGGMGRRAAAREFGLARKTVGKMLSISRRLGISGRTRSSGRSWVPGKELSTRLWKTTSNGRLSRVTQPSGSSSGPETSMAIRAATDHAD